jgi:hypothetical protein
MSYLILSVNGGIGKCIISTAIIEAFAEQRPDKKLVVVSGYPDVFINNPHVHRSYGFSNIQYFYETYIKDHDSEIFVHNPYDETDYTYNRKHLIEIWLRLCGLKYDAKYKPTLYLTQREVDFFAHKYMESDKPLFQNHTMQCSMINHRINNDHHVNYCVESLCCHKAWSDGWFNEC